MENFNFDQTRILYIIINFLLFILSGSIHEFAHSFSAYIQGDNTSKNAGRLTINPLVHIDLFGTIIFPLINILTSVTLLGWMKPVMVNPNNFRHPSRGHAITSFAGPFSNLIQATTAVLLYKIIYMISLQMPQHSSTIMDNIVWIVLIYFKINLILMIFNLLPFPPLDGGWILRHFLPDFLKAKYDRIYPYGIFFLFLLLFFNVFGFIIQWILLFGQMIINTAENAEINIIFFILPLIIEGCLFYLLLHNDLMIIRNKKKPAVVDQVTPVLSPFEMQELYPPIMSKNKQIMDLIVKLENKIAPDENDEKLIVEVRKLADLEKNQQNKICEDYDFDPADSYCNNCNDYYQCLVRRFDKLRTS